MNVNFFDDDTAKTCSYRSSVLFSVKNSNIIEYSKCNKEIVEREKERASLSSRYTVSVVRPHNFCYNDLSLNKQNLSFNNEDDWWRSIKQKEYLLTF